MKSSLRRLNGRHHYLVNLPRNICVTNDHVYVPLVVSTPGSFRNSWLITGIVTRVTRRVSLVEQELPNIPEHLSSPPRISGIRSFVFCVVFCRSLFVLLYFFAWLLYCLSFFHSQILISPLVSLNSLNVWFMDYWKFSIFLQTVISNLSSYNNLNSMIVVRSNLIGKSILLFN